MDQCKCSLPYCTNTAFMLVDGEPICKDHARGRINESIKEGQSLPKIKSTSAASAATTLRFVMDIIYPDDEDQPAPTA